MIVLDGVLTVRMEMQIQSCAEVATPLSLHPPLLNWWERRKEARTSTEEDWEYCPHATENKTNFDGIADWKAA